MRGVMISMVASTLLTGVAYAASAATAAAPIAESEKADGTVTVAGGGTATYLKNEHGVVIKLLATEVGLEFNLSADGVHIALGK